MLTAEWNQKFAPELKVTKVLLALEPRCDGKNAQLAYGVHQLFTYLPEYYQILASQIKSLDYGGKADENTLADTEGDLGLVTVYDALLVTGREYIAAQLFHEAAHLRKGGVDPDHVTCDHGALKDVELSCAQVFTGKLEGDAYNFTYVALEKFYRIDDKSIHKEMVLDEIQQLVKNSFNKIPKAVVKYWMKQPRLHPDEHVPIPGDIDH